MIVQDVLYDAYGMEKKPKSDPKLEIRKKKINKIKENIKNDKSY